MTKWVSFCATAAFPLCALPKFLLLRFGVMLQKGILSIFSVVQLLRRPVGRTVRSGVPTTPRYT